MPNLGKFEDVADFVLSGDGYDSASEVDEDEKIEVRAPSTVQEATGIQQRAVKLTEIGPRLRLELVKVEEGMCDGQILYHRYVQKTKVHLIVGIKLIASVRRKNSRRNTKPRRKKRLEGDKNKRQMLLGGRQRKKPKVRVPLTANLRPAKIWTLTRKKTTMSKSVRRRCSLPLSMKWMSESHLRRIYCLSTCNLVCSQYHEKEKGT